VTDGGYADSPDAVAPAVKQFVETYLPNLEHLEVLALLIQTPDKWWDAEAVGRQLGIPAPTGRRILEHLASKNLLAIAITAAVRYQYQPGRPAIREAATAFAEAYATQRLALIRLVMRPARRSIRDFAEAFRIQRDDDR
jgi:hypothetical protein